MEATADRVSLRDVPTTRSRSSASKRRSSTKLRKPGNAPPALVWSITTWSAVSVPLTAIAPVVSTVATRDGESTSVSSGHVRPFTRISPCPPTDSVAASPATICTVTVRGWYEHVVCARPARGKATRATATTTAAHRRRAGRAEVELCRDGRSWWGMPIPPARAPIRSRRPVRPTTESQGSPAPPRKSAVCPSAIRADRPAEGRCCTRWHESRLKAVPRVTLTLLTGHAQIRVPQGPRAMKREDVENEPTTAAAGTERRIENSNGSFCDEVSCS